MYKLLHYERADYSVVVKNRAPPPKAWRWEIYRAGNAHPIKQSSIYFVEAHYPGAEIRYIKGFKSKAEIDEWLQGSRRIDWLRSQGYAK